MRTILSSIAVLLGFSLLFVLGWAPRAHAQAKLGADLDYAVPLRAPAGVHTGGGFAIHAGAQAHLPLLVAEPEFVFTYDGFGGDAGPNAYRGLLGFRLGIGEIIRPAVFAHLGVGALHYGLLDKTRTAFSYDAGVGLDLTVIPLIDLGVHLGYNQIAASDHLRSFQWLTVGANAALVF